ncbi:MAG: SCO family protein [Hyphomicrobiaceae bacterium]|nr:SCO family protein [Hyphomicrobiaceae bacterium]
MRVPYLTAISTWTTISILAAATMLPTLRTYIFDQIKNWNSGQIAIGGPFQMVDHNNNKVSERSYHNRYLLVFFGFTHCPDACPTALQTVSFALQQLGPKADRISPLFITVDPERDTPETLKNYVHHFDHRITALTGSQEQVSKMIKNYRAYAHKVSNPKTPDNYTIDHSSYLYLMAPNGKFITHFNNTASYHEISHRISEVLG